MKWDDPSSDSQNCHSETPWQAGVAATEILWSWMKTNAKLMGSDWLESSSAGSPEGLWLNTRQWDGTPEMKISVHWDKLNSQQPKRIDYHPLFSFHEASSEILCPILAHFPSVGTTTANWRRPSSGPMRWEVARSTGNSRKAWRSEVCLAWARKGNVTSSCDNLVVIEKTSRLFSEIHSERVKTTFIIF